jgi:hypothetical protein
VGNLNEHELTTDFFLAQDFLHNFMVFLARFRNHESQYLQPLAQKATAILAARVSPSWFSTPAEDQMTNQDILSNEDNTAATYMGAPFD